MSSCDLVPTTILVFCSDPRFQGSFFRLAFSKLRLNFGQFFLIAVPGGGAALAESAVCPDERICIGQGIETALEKFGATITRIVLIGHEDCLHLNVPNDMIKNFLLEAGETVENLYSHFAVKLYFVRADESIETVEPSRQQQAQTA